jgi:hypothetical protein
LIRLTGISFCQCKMHSADCAQCMSPSSHSRHFQENSAFAFASRRKSIAASSTVEQGGVLDEPNSAPGTSSPSWAGGRTAASASGRRPWRPGRRRSQLGKRTATLPGGRADRRWPRLGEQAVASARWADGDLGERVDRASANGGQGPRRMGGLRPRSSAGGFLLGRSCRCLPLGERGGGFLLRLSPAMQKALRVLPLLVDTVSQCTVRPRNVFFKCHPC